MKTNINDLAFKEYLESINYETKIINDTELKKAKVLLTYLKTIRDKARYEKETFIYYDNLKETIELIRYKISGYEHLKNTNFRLDTLQKYVNENNLDKNEKIILSNALFNKHYETIEKGENI